MLPTYKFIIEFESRVSIGLHTEAIPSITAVIGIQAFRACFAKTNLELQFFLA